MHVCKRKSEEMKGVPKYIHKHSCAKEFANMHLSVYGMLIWDIKADE